MEAVVGINVAKETLAVALWRDGRGLEQATFANTRAEHNLVQGGDFRSDHFGEFRYDHDKACLEATGRY